MERTRSAVSYADRLEVERLTELRGLDEPDDPVSYVDRAITNFLGSAETDMATMIEAAESGDIDRLRDVTHRLAGSALNLGAVTLGEGARALEAHILSGEPAQALAALPGLVEPLAADLAALRAYQREQFPARG